MRIAVAAPKGTSIPDAAAFTRLRREKRRSPGWLATMGRDPIVWVLGLVCALALIAALYFTRATNPLNSDTPSYLYFDPSRTVGYPAFLWIAKTLAGSATFAVQAQMALLAGSLFLLGWSFYELVRRWKLALVFQAVLVVSPEVWHSSAQLMTEALATACVALWCAQLLRLVKHASLTGYFILALIAAVGTVIRPSLLALFAAAALAALLLRPRNRLAALLSLLPIAAAAWAATPTAYFFMHGTAATTSPFARGVLQHTLFCDQPSVSLEPDAAFVEQESRTVRKYIESAPAEIRTGLEHVYSAQLRFRSIIPVIGRAHRLTAAWQTDSVVGPIAEQRMKANPTCFAHDVLDSYSGLLTEGSAHSKTQASLINAYLAAVPPPRIEPQPLLPDDARALRKSVSELRVAAPVVGTGPPRVSETASPMLLLAGRILYACAAAIGLASLVALAARRRLSSHGRTLVMGMGALGVALHALFAGTALIELALIRYTVPAWPIVCTLFALAVFALRFREGRPAPGN